MPLRRALLSAAGFVALSGCGGSADSPAVAANTPSLPPAGESPKDPPAAVPAKEPPPKALTTTPQPTTTPAVPPVLPGDLAGKAVQKALMPSVAGGPRPPATKAPQPRPDTGLSRGEWPLPAAPLPALPATQLPKVKPAFPSPPVERTPLGLGDAAALAPGSFPLPDRPLLKAPSPVHPGAADVPAMARRLPDRASVEDPTVELSAKGVINTPLPLPAVQLPYLKEVIPNPFEFAEQLRGKLGKDTEFGTAPAVVNPEKK